MTIGLSNEAFAQHMRHRRGDFLHPLDSEANFWKWSGELQVAAMRIDPTHGIVIAHLITRPRVEAVWGLSIHEIRRTLPNNHWVCGVRVEFSYRAETEVDFRLWRITGP